MAGRPLRRYRALQAELADLEDVRAVILESKEVRVWEAEQFELAVRESYNPAPKFGTEAAWRAEDARFQRSEKDLAPVLSKKAQIAKASAQTGAIEDEYANDLASVERQRVGVMARIDRMRERPGLAARLAQGSPA